jgi:hypothetical protein
MTWIVIVDNSAGYFLTNVKPDLYFVINNFETAVINLI